MFLEQLESYLKAEIRYLRRRKLLPRRRGIADIVRTENDSSTGAYRTPSSPNSSDSDGEGHSFRPNKSVGGETCTQGTSEEPQFTFKQV